MVRRLKNSRAETLRRLRRSPHVADVIPLPQRVLDLTLVVLALPLALAIGALMIRPIREKALHESDGAVELEEDASAGAKLA